MIFLIHFTIALFSLLLIVLSCILFTNAIEFLGNKLKLSNNGVGSILAVIGTTLPETIVPIIAILGSYFISKDILTGQNIALGAILGSPFMLSTLALFLASLFIIFLRKNKEIKLPIEDIKRDYKYFIISYTIGFLAFFTDNFLFKIFISILLILIYFTFAIRTIKKSKSDFIECDCESLFLNNLFKTCNNKNLTLQIIISLFILFFSTHFFVEEIKYFSILINIHPAILSLFITPFATELPELINSLIWIKNKKDDLAFANILGAIIFQSSILFSIGIILTPWKLSQTLLINCTLTLVFSTLLYLSILITKKINPLVLISSGLIYFTYLIVCIF